MTTKKLCGYNNKTRRCNATSKMHPELCELGEKNYCRKKRLVLKKADLSKFMIGESQGKSLHGIKLSVLKSALQKYIRRSETEKAIQCLLEVNTFFQLEIADDTFVKEFNKQSTQKSAPFTKKALQSFAVRQITNIANRLLVIVSEEVNISDNPNIPSTVLSLYEKWRSDRSNPKAINHLIQIVIILSNAKKCRLISYLKSAFTLPPYYIKDEANYIAFYRDVILYKYSDVDKRSRSSIYNLDELKKLLKERNSEKIFRCLGEILMNREVTITKNFTLIWTLLLELTDNVNIIALHKIYKMMSHQEKPIYLYHAILIWTYADQLDFNHTVILPEVQKVKPLIVIEDDYVIDQHVKGKKNLASHIKLLRDSFYIDSAHLNERFMKKNYVEIYRDIKIGVGFYEENKQFPTLLQLNFYIEYYFGKKPVSLKDMEAASKMRDLSDLIKLIKINLVIITENKTEEFNQFLETLPLAQQRTGRNKKCTYIDFEKERIIKGPYSKTSFAMINALKYNYALEIMEKNTKCKVGWKWKELIQDDKNYYLVTDFVSDNYEKDPEKRKALMVFKEKESWEGGKSYYYFDRNSKVLGYRVKDMIDDNLLIKETTKNRTIIIGILQHFYLRMVLGIGDSGVSNILFVDKKSTKQVIAGIDLEEMRARFDKSSILKYLIGKEIKKQKKLFEPHIHSIHLLNWDLPKLKTAFSTLFLPEQVQLMKDRDQEFRILLTTLL